MQADEFILAAAFILRFIRILIAIITFVYCKLPFINYYILLAELAEEPTYFRNLQQQVFVGGLVIWLEINDAIRMSRF